MGNSSFLGIIAFIVLSGIFLLTGFRVAEERTAEAKKNQERQFLPEGASYRVSSRSNEGGALLQCYRQTLTGSGADRWLRWASSLAKTDVANFPDLLELLSERSREYEFLLDYWFQEDAKGLFNYWKARFDSDQAGRAYHLGVELWSRWFQRDPTEASAFVDQLVEERGGHYLKHSYILDALVDHDPKKGIQLISKYLPRYRTDAIGDTWPEVIGEEPGEWAEFLKRHPAGFLTESGMEEAGRIWGRKAPEEALKFSTELHGKTSEGFRLEVIRSWAKSDYESAKEWFFQQENARVRDQLRAPFLQGWASRNAEEASDWALENFKGERLRKAIEGIVFGAAAEGLESADQLWQKLAPATDQVTLLKLIERGLHFDPSRRSWNGEITPDKRAWVEQRRAELE